MKVLLVHVVQVELCAVEVLTLAEFIDQFVQKLHDRVIMRIIQDEGTFHRLCVSSLIYSEFHSSKLVLRVTQDVDASLFGLFVNSLKSLLKLFYLHHNGKLECVLKLVYLLQPVESHDFFDQVFPFDRHLDVFFAVAQVKWY